MCANVAQKLYAGIANTDKIEIELYLLNDDL